MGLKFIGAVVVIVLLTAGIFWFMENFAIKRRRHNGENE